MRVVIILKLPHVCRYHCYYVVLTVLRAYYFMSTHILTYFFMISGTKYTKNILVGSFAVLVRNEIHCNKYPGTRRVTSIGYPGSKISTRFNPSKDVVIALSRIMVKHVSR